MAKIKVWDYLMDKINNDSAVHLTLVDPDPIKQTAQEAGIIAKYATEAGTDAFMVGGSTAFGILDETIREIKNQTDLPVILFPGNVAGISKYADAVFFMSVLNSRNPYYIIRAQLTGAQAVKMFDLEPISMGYLILEPGGTAGYISEAQLIPRNKPQIAAAYALAAQYIGFKLVYLEGGSGVDREVPLEMISMVSSLIDIPLIVGGGLETPEQVTAVVRAGAEMVVQGTFVEKTVLSDNGAKLTKIIKAMKKEAKAKSN
ncbi:MAG: geranylgeranylglyceryl/heptaprenylglyceryl phosphate synthase [Candidatus Jordarchaeum sp.]|uniref:geranylgeranylglyceryl/heptaprenylglyceryl phosphate synthase n=1 Tax=Candidatus Jordarchaeum sp. TaxID=2823881 RepID=UPI004049BE85